MKTPDDILQTLSGLQTTDREWILSRLSVQARKNLLDGSLDQASAIRAEPTVRTDTSKDIQISAAIASADPAQLAMILTNEPAWVSHCVLSMGLPCSNVLLDHLSGPLRSRMDSAMPFDYPEPVKMQVRESLYQALQKAIPAPQRPRGFKGFIDGLNARLSSRRLRIGL